MKHFLLSLLLLLVATNITTNAQFKDWGTKYGIRYNFLFPQNEFPNVGFGENDEFSFKHYKMSYLLEGFAGFELSHTYELDLNIGYGLYAGYEFNDIGYYKSVKIPIELRLRIAPFDFKALNPYLFLGGGFVHHSNRGGDESSVVSPEHVSPEGWAGIFPLGIGFEFALSDMVLLDVSFGGAYTTTKDFNNYDDGNNVLDANYTAAVGLTLAGEGCSSDKDMDGIGKCEEEKLGTSPRNPDTDGDGLIDGEEVLVYKSNPLLADTDLDGLSDFDEVKKYQTDPLNADSDGDGLNDGEEVNKYSTVPLKIDSDGDGLSDGDEIIKYNTDPLKSDTDEDGLSDSNEINTYLTNPVIKDSDGDGLSDYDEVMTYKTNPLMKDTDGGTIEDGAEVTRGTNPLVADDDVIKVGVPIILEGITFAKMKADITPESESTLRKALTTLETYPDISVEISGHTDNVGSNAANQKLSERRANAVRDWLVRQGIDPTRITAAGYGESNPIAPNDTQEGKQKNRRIEFKRIK